MLNTLARWLQRESQRVLKGFLHDCIILTQDLCCEGLLGQAGINKQTVAGSPKDLQQSTLSSGCDYKPSKNSKEPQ